MRGGARCARRKYVAADSPVGSSIFEEPPRFNFAGSGKIIADSHRFLAFRQMPPIDVLADDESADGRLAIPLESRNPFLVAATSKPEIAFARKNPCRDAPPKASGCSSIAAAPIASTRRKSTSPC